MSFPFLDVAISYEYLEFNFDLIVPFIQQSYWGKGRTHHDIVQAFKNSFSIGFFAENGEQMAYRVSCLHI